MTQSVETSSNEQDGNRAHCETLSGEEHLNTVYRHEIDGHIIEIIIDHESWCSLSQSFEFAAIAAAITLNQSENNLKPQRSELAILLSSNKHVQSLNKAYRGKEKPTNVLAFPAHQRRSQHPESQESKTTSNYLGDIILGYETIADEAKTANKSQKDHLSHLIIHAVLHLLGYDHQTDTQANHMQTEERRLMLELGLQDPYDEPVQQS